MNKNSEEIVTIIRVLEYTGTRKWVENTLNKGHIPTNGIKVFGENCTIKSATLGTFTEIINNTYQKERLEFK